jgi:hypothetical protein
LQNILKGRKLMKIKLLALAAVTAIGVVAIKPPTTAHHAFSAEFDANLPVRLGGPITRIEWINPHIVRRSS